MTGVLTAVVVMDDPTVWPERFASHGILTFTVLATLFWLWCLYKSRIEMNHWVNWVVIKKRKKRKTGQSWLFSRSSQQKESRLPFVSRRLHYLRGRPAALVPRIRNHPTQKRERKGKQKSGKSLFLLHRFKKHTLPLCDVVFRATVWISRETQAIKGSRS